MDNNSQVSLFGCTDPVSLRHLTSLNCLPNQRSERICLSGIDSERRLGLVILWLCSVSQLYGFSLIRLDFHTYGLLLHTFPILNSGNRPKQAPSWWTWQARRGCLGLRVMWRQKRNRTSWTFL